MDTDTNKVCPKCGGHLVHEVDPNSFPYGDRVEFDRCVECGAITNIKGF